MTRVGEVAASTTSNGLNILKLRKSLWALTCVLVAIKLWLMTVKCDVLLLTQNLVLKNKNLRGSNKAKTNKNKKGKGKSFLELSSKVINCGVKCQIATFTMTRRVETLAKGKWLNNGFDLIRTGFYESAEKSKKLNTLLFSGICSIQIDILTYLSVPWRNPERHNVVYFVIAFIPLLARLKCSSKMSNQWIFYSIFCIISPTFGRLKCCFRLHGIKFSLNCNERRLYILFDCNKKLKIRGILMEILHKFLSWHSINSPKI